MPSKIFSRSAICFILTACLSLAVMAQDQEKIPQSSAQKKPAQSAEQEKKILIKPDQ